jgi:hypothetical protein
MKPKPAILTILFIVYLGIASLAAADEIYKVHWPIIKHEFIEKKTHQDIVVLANCDNVKMDKGKNVQFFLSNAELNIYNMNSDYMVFDYTAELCNVDTNVCGDSHWQRVTVAPFDHIKTSYILKMPVKVNHKGDFHFRITVDTDGAFKQHSEKTCGVHVS